MLNYVYMTYFIKRIIMNDKFIQKTKFYKFA